MAASEAIEGERRTAKREGIGDPVAWHDAENGGYGADLALWERLARVGGGPVLDLGAGTGRVSLHLARRDIATIALDADADLLAALSERAVAAGLNVPTVCADARALGALGLAVNTVIAPMQLIHLLGGVNGRVQLLRGALEVLPPGGRLHLALLGEEAETEVGGEIVAPLPDVREQNGWVHSSRPTAVGFGPEVIRIQRRRQLVSPVGDLREEDNVIELDRLSPAELEAEAGGLGYAVLDRTPIPLTAEHVGSIVVSLEAPR